MRAWATVRADYGFCTVIDRPDEQVLQEERDHGK